MSRACTLVLVGVASSVSEIQLPFKNSQISLLGHRLHIVIKKFNQSELVQKIHASRDQCHVHVLYTSFGGCGLSGFGDMATFQKCPNFPFGAWI